MSGQQMFTNTLLVCEDGHISAPRVILYIVFPDLQHLLKEREDDETLYILLPQVNKREVRNLLKTLRPLSVSEPCSRQKRFLTCTLLISSCKPYKCNNRCRYIFSKLTITNDTQTFLMKYFYFMFISLNKPHLQRVKAEIYAVKFDQN